MTGDVFGSLADQRGEGDEGNRRGGEGQRCGRLGKLEDDADRDREKEPVERRVAQEIQRQLNRAANNTALPGGRRVQS